MHKLELTKHELESPAIRKLRAHLEQQVHECRLSNDAVQHNESSTSFIRGKIAVLKTLIIDLTENEHDRR